MKPVKLTAEEVSLIVKKLLSEWQSERLVRFRIPETELHDRLAEIFLKDLRVEDDLHLEIEELLKKYEKEFDKGTLDRRKMFNLVKAQLVKERKLVL